MYLNKFVFFIYCCIIKHGKIKRTIKMTNNKTNLKNFLIVFTMLFFAICTCFAFAGCSPNIVVTNIEKSSSTEQDNTYTIYYSNGQTSTIKIANGKDGKDVSIDDIYDKYVETYGEITYADFLKLYFNIKFLI